ncbi:MULTISPECIES: hypothetical protein [unclassified Coleofasciculus]|uniref:hypothetical protein n=1 Tax=unclassified Coleofasciculus TaxID=2692782 RepID=UPI00187E52F6|nr:MULTISPECIES: hypothetical protein [unclassified Coleofasciculus]MBE9128019.1 hypothetical protein [Coleofasciculus sp. LEGE 07081]MBE9150541.1 hypothetical protein [Coleofasciculus sp. LEGE 07092]
MSTDEQQLAELAGFETPTTDNPIDQSELFGERENPHEVKTKPTLSSNPYAKAGVVGVALMIVFGVGGFFAAQMAGVDLKKAPSLVQPKQEETPKLVQKAEAQEVGELKTELAIASQEQQLKAVSESKKPRSDTALKAKPSPPSSPTSTTTQPPPTVKPTPPSYRSYSPPPPSPRRITPLPPPPTVRPSPPAPPPVSVQPLPAHGTPAPLPTSLLTPPTTPVIEQTDWLTLAAVGSYGSAPIETDSTVEPLTTVENNPTTTPTNSGIQFQVGQAANARTVTPIICTSTAQSDQRFIVELTESITSSNDWELMSPGTQVVMTCCNQVQETGMVSAQAIALIKDGTEYPIPPGAISIRGESDR